MISQLQAFVFQVHRFHLHSLQYCPRVPEILGLVLHLSLIEGCRVPAYCLQLLFTLFACTVGPWTSDGLTDRRPKRPIVWHVSTSSLPSGHSKTMFLGWGTTCHPGYFPSMLCFQMCIVPILFAHAMRYPKALEIYLVFNET
jgi:hypothetical protein